MDILFVVSELQAMQKRVLTKYYTYVFVYVHFFNSRKSCEHTLAGQKQKIHCTSLTKAQLFLITIFGNNMGLLAISRKQRVSKQTVYFEKRTTQNDLQNKLS